jgi:hypothetical protein
MKAKYILLTILACMAASSRIDAQTAYLQGVKTENLKVYRQKGNVSVAMDITVDGLDIRSNDMVILTPVIKSNRDETAICNWLPWCSPEAGAPRSSGANSISIIRWTWTLKEAPYAVVKQRQQQETGP